MAKVGIAALLAALALALLGYAGSGQLGNFGGVGIDQGTFGFAIFLWFTAIGALTVLVAGGIRRRPRAAKPVRVGRPPAEPPVLADPLADFEADDAEVRFETHDAPGIDEPQLEIDDPPPPRADDRPSSSPDEDR
jgi:hypothetical protein